MTVSAFHSECSFDTLDTVMSVGKVHALVSLLLSHSHPYMCAIGEGN